MSNKILLNERTEKLLELIDSFKFVSDKGRISGESESMKNSHLTRLE